VSKVILNPVSRGEKVRNSAVREIRVANYLLLFL
jgi:hypothetical protein